MGFKHCYLARRDALGESAYFYLFIFFVVVRACVCVCVCMRACVVVAGHRRGGGGGGTHTAARLGDMRPSWWRRQCIKQIRSRTKWSDPKLKYYVARRVAYIPAPTYLRGRHRRRRRRYVLRFYVYVSRDTNPHVIITFRTATAAAATRTTAVLFITCTCPVPGGVTCDQGGGGRTGVITPLEISSISVFF